VSTSPFRQRWFVDEVFVRISGLQRSHIPTRYRLRNSRGLRTTATPQRFLENSSTVRHAPWPGCGMTIGGSEHERVRQVTTAFLQLGRHLRRAR